MSRFFGGVAIVIHLLGAPLGAQWSPARETDPVQVEVAREGDDLRVTLRIDAGWYVYGPGADGIGLPLHVSHSADGPFQPPTALQATDSVRFDGRPAPIHRGVARFIWTRGAAGAPTEVFVRWAACRGGELCLPRESRVPLPASSPPSVRRDPGAPAP